MKIIQISAIWCNSCLVMQKTWNACKKQYPNIEWVTYDLDFDEEQVRKYEVGEKLPILILEKDGEEINRLVGEKKQEEVEVWLKNNIQE